MPLQQFDERILRVTRSIFNSAHTPGTYYLMFGETPFDLRIDTMQAFNSDNIDHNWSYSEEGGGDASASGGIVLPARAGYDGIPSVDVLALTQPSAFHFLGVPSGTTLESTLREAVTAGAFVMIYCQGGYI